MRPDLLPDDPRALWRDGSEVSFRLAPAERRGLLEREQRRLRRLTWAQYAGMLVGLVGFSVIAIVFRDPMMRAGSALLALVFLHVLFELRLTSRMRTAAQLAGPAADPAIAFLRAELVRQRELLSGPRFWRRFAIGIPSGILFFLGFARAQHRLAPVIHLQLVMYLVLFAASIVIARHRVATFTRRIAELDALRDS